MTRPLNYSEKRLLSAIAENPGASRAELAALLYQAYGTHTKNALRKVAEKVKRLESRGLVELGVIREGGRYGVPGVYLVGQKRSEKPGYLGVYGWVDTQEARDSREANRMARELDCEDERDPEFFGRGPGRAVIA